MGWGPPPHVPPHPSAWVSRHPPCIADLGTEFLQAGLCVKYPPVALPEPGEVGDDVRPCLWLWQPPTMVPSAHRASTSAALSLATSLLRWRWVNCFFALSSSFTVSSSSACAFCSRSMPCRERQLGGDSCPHHPRTGDRSLPQYLFEHPLLGEAGSPGSFCGEAAVALRSGDTDLPGMRGPLNDAFPDSNCTPVGTRVKTGKGTLLPPCQLLQVPSSTASTLNPCSPLQVR